MKVDLLLPFHVMPHHWLGLNRAGLCFEPNLKGDTHDAATSTSMLLSPPGTVTLMTVAATSARESAAAAGAQGQQPHFQGVGISCWDSVVGSAQVRH